MRYTAPKATRRYVASHYLLRGSQRDFGWATLKLTEGHSYLRSLGMSTRAKLSWDLFRFLAYAESLRIAFCICHPKSDIVSPVVYLVEQDLQTCCQ